MPILIILIIIIILVVKPKWLSEANRTKLIIALGVILILSGAALFYFSGFAEFRSTSEKEMVKVLMFVGIVSFIVGIIIFVMALNGQKKNIVAQVVEKNTNNSVADELEKLNNLLEKKIITQEEFDAQKVKLLS